MQIIKAICRWLLVLAHLLMMTLMFILISPLLLLMLIGMLGATIGGAIQQYILDNQDPWELIENNKTDALWDWLKGKDKEVK